MLKTSIIRVVREIVRGERLRTVIVRDSVVANGPRTVHLSGGRTFLRDDKVDVGIGLFLLTISRFTRQLFGREQPIPEGAPWTNRHCWADSYIQVISAIRDVLARVHDDNIDERVPEM